MAIRSNGSSTGRGFSSRDSFALPLDVTDVRSFGAHESGGTWSVYAGVEPTGVLRGTWSKSQHTLIFSPVPELSVLTRNRGARSDPEGHRLCRLRWGALRDHQHQLYRRNDGALPPGVSRWTPLRRSARWRTTAGSGV